MIRNEQIAGPFEYPVRACCSVEVLRAALRKASNVFHILEDQGVSWRVGTTVVPEALLTRADSPSAPTNGPTIDVRFPAVDASIFLDSVRTESLVPVTHMSRRCLVLRKSVGLKEARRGYREIPQGCGSIRKTTVPTRRQEESALTVHAPNGATGR